ncbi:MAG TPA: phage tail protein [Gaiellaceae bacterium]|nr:phage tail protein [Gaiellaceae bacterium]
MTTIERPTVTGGGDGSLQPVPPGGLTPDSFAARLYTMLEPLAQSDPSYGWALLILCNAIGTEYQSVEDWVRDTPAGPGFSLLLDVDRCPPEALGWLAQFVGVRLRSGDSDADNRHRIVSTDGFRRGTYAAIQGAAYATLVGSKSVFIWERDHDPADTPDYAYYLTVSTYADQTPDQAATERAILAQKPAGLVLTYIVQDGQTYSQVKSRFATYADVSAAYATYAAMAHDEPGVAP